MRLLSSFLAVIISMGFLLFLLAPSNVDAVKDSQLDQNPASSPPSSPSAESGKGELPLVIKSAGDSSSHGVHNLGRKKSPEIVLENEPEIVPTDNVESSSSGLVPNGIRRRKVFDKKNGKVAEHRLNIMNEGQDEIKENPKESRVMTALKTVVNKKWVKETVKAGAMTAMGYYAGTRLPPYLRDLQEKK